MRNYLVLIQNNSDSQGVQERFETLHYRFSETLFAVGSDAPTPADLCERLGINAECPGIAVGMDRCYGHFDMALWQKLDAVNRK